MKSKLFAVKTIYISSVARQNKKLRSQQSLYMLEERIVLIRSLNPANAIKKAEKEAVNYEMRYLNPSGEEVGCKYIGLCETFEIKDKLEEWCEVYSHRELFDGRPNFKTLANSKLGKNWKKRGTKMWEQFKVDKFL